MATMNKTNEVVIPFKYKKGETSIDDLTKSITDTVKRILFSKVSDELKTFAPFKGPSVYMSDIFDLEYKTPPLEDIDPATGLISPEDFIAYKYVKICLTAEQAVNGYKTMVGKLIAKFNPSKLEKANTELLARQELIKHLATYSKEMTCALSRVYHCFAYISDITSK